ncbi:hypothetical protein CTEN210_00715 [Chaetoceros tenuissimus]|uniref:Prolyl 4-hydroxylase alpha subunit Fe(2+) 2OG dioxygenase domain-containing protein n=1 Tax=Chaetoceros tenuissimus TaxID=426638 RepID=A0AAD3CG85_9STRA|nr:hypothetical protein CTEN210_00715 [Chaetoceros tenuissimus]
MRNISIFLLYFQPVTAFLTSSSKSSSKNILPRVSRNNLPRLQEQSSSSKLLNNSLDVIERIDSQELIGQDYSIIRKGGIYIQQDFITSAEVTALQNDIKQLYNSNQFIPSGLSNRVEGDKNEFGEEDRLTCTITPILLKGDDSFIRQVVEEKLETLKQELEETLFQENAVDGVSMEESNLDLVEMYYSISPKGSILPRHQDERHEDTKGEKGWMHDTRRSISWLIYLNNDWCTDNQEASGGGGQFRAYCRKCIENVQCGSNDGNLQIGWLSSSQSPEDDFEPVFLDSWVQMPKAFSDDADEILYDDEEPGYEQLKWRPMSALYRVRSDPDDLSSNRDLLKTNSVHSLEIKYPNREYLSQPFGADSTGWPNETELDPSDFIQALASQLSDKNIRQRFVGLEEIKGQGVKIVDVEPTAGTLVLFDSVVVPHEVLKVTSGERLAIAGWFHETVQDFPDWYGT